LIQLRTLRLFLAFDGSAYHGWQRQNNARSVQACIEDALGEISGKREPVIGCSRTDAGVHAAVYCCSVRTEIGLDCATLTKALNAKLPRDVAVFGCEEMPEDFHAQYSCLEKEYQYIAVAEERIAKVKREENSLFDLSLEVKPPQVKIQKLIETGFLFIGENMFNEKGNCIGTLTDKGYVHDGMETLSIHKMSAKCLNLPNNNGWDFFYVRRESALKSIDDLRYEYSSQEMRMVGNTAPGSFCGSK
jgi:tRNA pseudouridine(38-40) synthase